MFARSQTHRTYPLTAPKVVGAIGHIATPLTTYAFLRHHVGERLLNAMGGIHSVAPSDARIAFFTATSALYGVRWGIAQLIAFNDVTWGASLAQIVLHHLIHVVAYGVLAIAGEEGAPAELTAVDHAAILVAVAAAVFQTGSEIQRWFFKRSPNNSRGKLYTGGMFRFAQFINHTGHILNELAMVLASRSLGYGVWGLFGAKYLVTDVIPETRKHLKAKYGEQYEKFEKQTPWLLVPGVY